MQENYFHGTKIDVLKWKYNNHTGQKLVELHFEMGRSKLVPFIVYFPSEP